MYRSVQIPQKAAEVILESWCYYQEGWDSGDPWVLVLYQEDWNSGGPSGWRLDSREFPAVYRSVQIPQKAAEVILESWCYTRRAGTAVILGSWCYTRKTGTAVVQADGGLIPGNSQRCIARYKFPRRRRQLDLHQ